MYVSNLATSDFDIYSNKLNRYDLKRCQGFRLKFSYFQKGLTRDDKRSTAFYVEVKFRRI